MDEAADSFLASYDIDNNETISIFEIIEEENRKNLAADLSKKRDDNEQKSQLDNIIKAIEKLEDEVTKYRQRTMDKTNVEEKSKYKRKQASNQLQVITDNQANGTQAQVGVSPK